MDEIDRKLAEVGDSIAGAVDALHKAVGPGAGRMVRLESLKLAIRGREGWIPDEIIRCARQFADFIEAEPE